jgi:DNA gyrase subunit A
VADEPTTPTDGDQPDGMPTSGTEPESGGVIVERIEPVVIEDEMRASYLDYAMSVIVGRALPDVRDGLKPVHRRILFSMDEGNLRPSGPYRKCASAVGDVMKKYHPHGDTAIYDALVRMGQDFSSRYMLIDGHGNFGSIDGDRAAAMRYTESRLSTLAMELLRGIDEETVDFTPNYDGYEVEPTVLPARYPNLLANGATGIAVGMATNIPPHNLGEVIDATFALMEDPTLTAADLMEYIPAPDFPTGGQILGQGGAYQAYTTGRGSVRIRSVCTIEEDPSRKNCMRIVVTEIPYMVNKSTMAIKIAKLVEDKVVPGIHDLRDETSNRTGIRLVIELKREANPQVVLNQLYKHSPLQDSFGMNMLALVDGVPKTLTLDKFLTHYIAHQVEVIERRTAHRLRVARERAHVLEGYLIALANIEDVIALIRASASADAARGELMSRFELSDIQANAILNMPLRRLAALEAQAIQDEYDQLMLTIADLEEILATPARVHAIIREELSEVRDKHADPRRSQIVPDDGDMTVEDLIADQTVVITLTSSGYIKRTPIDQYRAQKRGGKGVMVGEMKDDDLVDTLLTCGVKDYLLVFTNEGRSYRIKAFQIPERGRASRGVYVANVNGLAFEPDEKVAAILKIEDFDGEHRHLVFGTRNGTVKRTKLSAFDSPRATLIAINLVEGDELIAVRASDGDQTVVMVSSNGKAIRFLESDARAMGRNSTGVRGMRLQGDAKVLSMGLALTPGEVPAELRALEESASAVLKEAELLFAEQAAAIDDEIEIPAELRSLRQRAQLAGDAVLDIVNPDRLSVLTVTQTGKGKRTGVEAYKVQGRGGQGIGTHDLKNTAKTGGLAGALIVPEDAEVMMFTDSGTIIRTPLEDVRMAGRSTQGVSMMRTGEDVKVVGLALVVDDVVDEELLEEGAEPTDDVTEATATTADPTSNHAGSDAESETADTSSSDED